MQTDAPFAEFATSMLFPEIPTTGRSPNRLRCSTVRTIFCREEIFSQSCFMVSSNSSSLVSRYKTMSSKLRMVCLSFLLVSQNIRSGQLAEKLWK
jgi:hypothetical protein